MPFGKRTPRSRVVSTSAIRTRRRRAPSIASIAARRRCKSFTTPVPIVPKPIRPARISGTFGSGTVGTGGRRGGPAEGLPDAPHRLTGPMLVFDQREAHVLVAVLPEADARRHRHFSLLEQEFRELDGAHRPQGLRDAAPDEHG